MQAAQEEICAGAGREVEFTFQHVQGQQNYGGACVQGGSISCRRFRLLRLRLCLAGTLLSLFADVLCQFAKEKAAHVLVIGHGGHSRKSTASTVQGATEEQTKLGSVVERCCEVALMSVLITKGTGRHDNIVDGDGSTKMGNEVGGGGGMAEATGADSLAAGTDY